MHSVTIFTLIILSLTARISSSSTSRNKEVLKRSASYYPEEFLSQGLVAPGKVPPFQLSGPWISPPRQFPPTQSEVSNVIAAAKQASANVLIAQQQVQAAKENVLNQQRVAMDKETSAAILTQKSETAAAVQRSEAAAAAQAVILAQHRLAAAKAAVAHQQRIAAAKEAEAASALQSSAHAAAAEIQRTENEATKYANLQRTGAAAIAHHVTATKDAILAPLTSGQNHIPNFAIPWQTPAAAVIAPHVPWTGTAPAAGSLYVPSKATFAVSHLWG